MGAEQLERLVEERGSVDAWRHMRPTSGDLTHLGNRWQTGARVDRWYVSAPVAEWQLHSSIQGLTPVSTDLFPMSVEMCTPDLRVPARAPWQLHPAYLDNPALLDCLVEFLRLEAAHHAAQLPAPRGHST
uniref:hypothetical protein n=1 Tax=Hydrogenophaga sp. TaxID=1904254 RepID=UPI0040364F39